LTQVPTGRVPPALPAPTRGDAVTLAKKPDALKGFSPFRSGLYYCSSCTAWLHVSEAVFDRARRPRCPRCGRVLRARPRWYRGKG
jgi:predicted RNA-binding Zn-ribbon protein involved in translation (DUF1610 family)